MSAFPAARVRHGLVLLVLLVLQVASTRWALSHVPPLGAWFLKVTLAAIGAAILVSLTIHQHRRLNLVLLSWLGSGLLLCLTLMSSGGVTGWLLALQSLVVWIAALVALSPILAIGYVLLILPQLDANLQVPARPWSDLWTASSR